MHFLYIRVDGFHHRGLQVGLRGPYMNPKLAPYDPTYSCFMLAKLTLQTQSTLVFIIIKIGLTLRSAKFEVNQTSLFFLLVNDQYIHLISLSFTFLWRPVELPSPGQPVEIEIRSPSSLPTRFLYPVRPRFGIPISAFHVITSTFEG